MHCSERRECTPCLGSAPSLAHLCRSMARYVSASRRLSRALPFDSMPRVHCPCQERTPGELVTDASLDVQGNSIKLTDASIRRTDAGVCFGMRPHQLVSSLPTGRLRWWGHCRLFAFAVSRSPATGADGGAQPHRRRRADDAGGRAAFGRHPPAPRRDQPLVDAGHAHCRRRSRGQRRQARKRRRPKRAWRRHRAKAAAVCTNTNESAERLHALVMTAPMAKPNIHSAGAMHASRCIFALPSCRPMAVRCVLVTPAMLCWRAQPHRLSPWRRQALS